MFKVYKIITPAYLLSNDRAFENMYETKIFITQKILNKWIVVKCISFSSLCWPLRFVVGWSCYFRHLHCPAPPPPPPPQAYKDVLAGGWDISNTRYLGFDLPLYWVNCWVTLKYSLCCKMKNSQSFVHRHSLNRNYNEGNKKKKENRKKS